MLVRMLLMLTILFFVVPFCISFVFCDILETYFRCDHELYDAYPF